MNTFFKKNKTNEAICIRNVNIPIFQGAVCTIISSLDVVDLR